MSDGACEICRNWLVERFTEYAFTGEYTLPDGRVITNRVTNWKPVKEGHGLCSVLNQETPADFGCKKFEEGHSHTERKFKNGAPWRHWDVKACPGCSGIGSHAQLSTVGGYPQMVGGACDRCKGTGKVRHYDDGWIGEEGTRLHPMEKEEVGPLKCGKCDHEVDPKWMACPFCGTKIEGEAKPTVVDGILGNAGQDLKSPLAARREQLRTEIAEQNDALNIGGSPQGQGQ